MKPFIDIRFAYCPVIWMFDSGELKRKINQMHQWRNWIKIWGGTVSRFLGIT